MATFGNGSKVVYGLSGYGAATKSQVGGDNPGGQQVGPTQKEINYSGVRPVWSTRVTFGAAAQYVTLNPLTGVATPTGAGATADLTTDVTGANNDLVYTSILSGSAGNATRIRYVIPDEAFGALTVEVSGQDITVNLAHTGGVSSSSASSVAFAIESDGVASTLVSVTNKPGNTGLGTITAAMAFTALAGGIDAAAVAIREGDGNDWEGKELPDLSDNCALLLIVRSGRVIFTDGGAAYSFPVRAKDTLQPGVALIASDLLEIDGDITITCDEGPADFDILLTGVPTP